MINHKKHNKENYMFDSLLEKVIEKIKTIQILRSSLNDIKSIDDMYNKKNELIKLFLEVEDEIRHSAQAMKSLNSINKNLCEQIYDFEEKLKENDKYIEKLKSKNRELNETLSLKKVELQSLSDQHVKTIRSSEELQSIIQKLNEKIILKSSFEVQSPILNKTILNSTNKVDNNSNKEMKIREIISFLLNSKYSLNLNQYCKNIHGKNFIQQLLSEDAKDSFVEELDNTIKEFDFKQENMNPHIIFSEGEINNHLIKSNSNSFIKHTEAYTKNFSFQICKSKNLVEGRKIAENIRKDCQTKKFIQYTKPHGNYFDKDYNKKYISQDNRENELGRLSSPSFSLSSPLNRFNNKNDQVIKIRTFKENSKWRSMNDYFYSQFENDNGSNFQQKSPDKITTIIKY